MKIFSSLYIELEQEHRIQRRVDVLASYFQTVSEENGAIALSILLGSKIKSVVKRELLAQLACETAHIRSWMFDECLTHGNNYLDTVSMIVPRARTVRNGSLQKSLSWLESLRKLDADECNQEIISYWSMMDIDERIVINQMLCGVLKFEVSLDELTAALALCLELDKGIIRIRLSKWKNMISSLNDLRIPIDELEEFALPEVFQPSWDWSNAMVEMLNPETCQAKWVLDGIKVQVVKVRGEVFIWGEDKKLFWNRFPELEFFVLGMDENYILHGTLVGWSTEGVDKVVLQKRESKKNITARIIADFPIRLFVSELKQRKENSSAQELISKELHELFLRKINNVASPILWNEDIVFNAWEELFAIQSNQKLKGSVGLEIKPSSLKEVGNDQGKRFFKRNEPHSLNLILLYVKLGSYGGDKSGEEYTFGVRHGSTFLPIARVSSLQNDEERTFIKEFVKFNTMEKFGPVRNVNPCLVFKISFASIYVNERKKAGVELVNSNVICRLDQLFIDDAHQMQDVLELLPKA